MIIDKMRTLNSIIILLPVVALSGLYACTEKNEVPDVVFPELALQDTVINVGEEGGVFQIAYSLTHTLDSAFVAVSCSEDWIEARDSESIITVTVDRNELKTPRSGDVIVEYRLGNNFIQKSIQVNQDATLYDYILEASDAVCEYYGDMLGMPGTPHNYYLMVSDLGWDVGNAKVYKFDMFLPAPDNANRLALLPGTYPLGEPGRTEPMTFTPDFSMYSVNNQSATENVSIGFTDGELTVELQGEDYVLDAVLKDVNGETHHMIYTGPIQFKDYYEPAPDVSSILTDDFTADLTRARLEATFDGDYYGYGTYIWYLHILNDGWTGDSFIIELCSPYNDFSGGIPDGRYAVSSSGDEFTAIQGYASYPFESGSWLYQYDEQAAQTKVSPLYSGVISVTNHTDGTTTVEIDCMDDNLDEPHKITGTWTGTVVYNDNTSSMSSPARPGSGRSLPRKL